MIALITYLYGGEDYSNMYQLCRYRGEEVKPLLEVAYYIGTYWE